MEAARVAAQRGHHVALYDKATYLGGLIPLAAIVKDLETQDMTIFVRYLQTQLKKEGVTVHLGEEVTEDVITKEKPDVVVVAAGAEHSTFDIPGSSHAKVLPGAKLHKQLKFWLKLFSSAQMQKLSKFYMPVGKRVAVVGGTLHGCELTEFLTKRDRKVTMVHNGPKEELGQGMTIDDLENLWPWLKKKGVPIFSAVQYQRVTDKGLVIRGEDGREITLEVDNIITTQDFVPNLRLSERLKPLVPEVYTIGSSREPGLIVDAMKEGAKIGYSV
jgi:2,4-dienoyl-CoA reductase (NADPH2)